MSGTDEALRILRKLGLSGYESRVYLSLLGGASTPREISEISGVPTSRVYDVLSRLAEKGFAVRVSRSSYSPVSPAAAAASLAARIRAAADVRAAEVESAARKLASMLEPTEVPRTTLELLRGLPQITARVISISKRVDRMYFIVRKALEALPELRPMVGSIGRRGIDIRVIVPPDPGLSDRELALAREADIEVRVSAETPFDAAIAGGRYFLLGIPDPAYPLPDKAVAILIDDVPFASTVERYFLRLWGESRPP